MERIHKNKVVNRIAMLITLTEISFNLIDLHFRALHCIMYYLGLTLYLLSCVKYILVLITFSPELGDKEKFEGNYSREILSKL